MIGKEICKTWVQFIVDSCPCTENFFSRSSGFPPSPKPSLQIPIQPGKMDRKSQLMEYSPLNHYLLLLLLLLLLLYFWLSLNDSYNVIRNVLYCYCRFFFISFCCQWIKTLILNVFSHQMARSLVSLTFPIPRIQLLELYLKVFLHRLTTLYI